jgi:methylphosphotriester-DNA--protein-cysteine methyltransferase
MYLHSVLQQGVLLRKVKHRAIRCAGNMQLKIFGQLDCKSGKRMKKENRVFFASEMEAISNGFRPCAHCMPAAYRVWKSSR